MDMAISIYQVGTVKFVTLAWFRIVAKTKITIFSMNKSIFILLAVS